MFCSAQSCPTHTNSHPWTLSKMASHPHIPSHTCTQTPPIHLHTHPHPIQPVTDCWVRSRHSLHGCTLWIATTFHSVQRSTDVLGECGSWVYCLSSISLMEAFPRYIDVSGGARRKGAWCHCHFSDWFRSDMTRVTMADTYDTYIPQLGCMKERRV